MLSVKYFNIIKELKQELQQLKKDSASKISLGKK